MTAGSKVVVVVRPESINLHQQQPANGSNVIAGKIGAAMFLGEYVDCTIELGKNILQTHQRYTLQVRRGDPGLGRVARRRMHGAARGPVTATISPTPTTLADFSAVLLHRSLNELNQCHIPRAVVRVESKEEV